MKEYKWIVIVKNGEDKISECKYTYYEDAKSEFFKAIKSSYKATIDKIINL